MPSVLRVFGLQASGTLGATNRNLANSLSGDFQGLPTIVLQIAMSKSGSCLRQSRNKHFICTGRKLNARLKGCGLYGLTSFGKNLTCGADLGGGSALSGFQWNKNDESEG